MSKSLNTGRESVNQSSTVTKDHKVDHRKANDLEANLMSDLVMAVRFVRLAHDHSEIFDHQGFVLSVEKFLDHARAASSKLKELRKVRGVTD